MGNSFLFSSVNAIGGVPGFLCMECFDFDEYKRTGRFIFSNNIKFAS